MSSNKWSNVEKARIERARRKEEEEKRIKEEREKRIKEEREKRKTIEQATLIDECNKQRYKKFYGYLQITDTEPIKVTKLASCLYSQDSIGDFLQFHYELMVLHNYTYGFDYMINTFLRSKEIREAIKNDTDVDKPINDLINNFKKHGSRVRSADGLLTLTNKEIRVVLCNMIDTIDSIFQRVTKLKVPVRLYRGQKEDVMTGDSYISTSRALNAALKFSDNTCCVYVLDVQPGVAVLPLFEVSKLSDEYEVLIERNCILKKKETKDLYLEYNSNTVWHDTRIINELLDKYHYFDKTEQKFKERTPEEIEMVDEELKELFKIVESPTNNGSKSTNITNGKTNAIRSAIRRVKLHFYEVHPPTEETTPYCKVNRTNGANSSNKANNK
jgi:hypothetical protein